MSAPVTATQPNLKGGRHEWRVVPCECGGILSAFNDLDAIRDAVVLHQEAEPHRSWSARNYPSLAPEPTPWYPARDVSEPSPWPSVRGRAGVAE